MIVAISNNLFDVWDYSKHYVRKFNDVKAGFSDFDCWETTYFSMYKFVEVF